METSGGTAPVARFGGWLALGALALATLAACASSPEAARVRGGGPGGDTGNRGDPVQLQGDQPYPARVYYETPRDLPPAGTAPAG